MPTGSYIGAFRVPPGDAEPPFAFAEHIAFGREAERHAVAPHCGAVAEDGQPASGSPDQDAVGRAGERRPRRVGAGKR